jgi:rare lipoprotein A
LKPWFLKLAAISGALIWLTACTTTLPRSPSEMASATGAAQSRLLLSIPDFVAKPFDNVQQERKNDTPPPVLDSPRSALLAGESAREYQRGGASWYGPGFHGRRSASGERFDMHSYTAAHRTLPFGTWVRVHSLVNGREVDVRITDRGPFIRSRVIDLSRGAAQALGMLGLGFKEVVLLVPESTPDIVDLPLPAASGVEGRGLVKRGSRVR